METGIETIKQCLGELPFFTVTEEKEKKKNCHEIADGTYATQSPALETAMSPPTFVQGTLSSIGNLRSLILSGDFFLGAVVACTLTNPEKQALEVSG